ncbi:MAG: trans-2,3-dihydro-3-hydroxyanthranilate isomerase [Oceanospirillaceae bacterium]|jgi:trans-2,3-dihydro-3-hydroxyanthranilate isomerase
MNIQDRLIKQPSNVPFSMYDAFTDVPYSGSQAAIVLHASDISIPNRVRIAREIGAPATAFVNAINHNRVKVQFFSTVMELPMCGHGTVCLITQLVAQELLPCEGDGWCKAVLDLPKGEATVECRRTKAGRVEVMLDVAEAQFAAVKIDLEELAGILGVSIEDMSNELPPEVATGDFIHLCLPMRDLDAMRKLQPDFSALAKFCVSNGLDTVASFSTEVVDQTCNVHVRDFCPAVGVAESAAAGTTNAALSTYLLQKGLVQPSDDGSLQVRAEQGIELGRPSRVTTRIKTQGGHIMRLQVGGLASLIVDGMLNVKLDSL